MSLRALVAKLDSLLAKDTQTADGQGTVVQVLTDSYERLGAILTKVQEANGLLPDGMSNELTTVAGMLLSLSPMQAAPTPSPGTAGPPNVTAAAATAPATPLTLVAAKAERGELSKAELDAYTFRVTTLSAARDRMWKVGALFDQGKDTEAIAEMKGITDMLNNVAQTPADPNGAASTTDGTTKREVTLTAPQFAQWAIGEVKKASGENKVEAKKRLVHLAEQTRLAKAYFFEDVGPTPKFEMLAAYAPEADGATNMDLTTKPDQTQVEGDIVGGNSADTTSMFSKGDLDSLNKALESLVGAFKPAEGTPAAAAPAGSTPAAEPEAFTWPGDLSAQMRDEAQAAKKADPKSPLSKRVGAGNPDNYWGKDPSVRR